MAKASNIRSVETLSCDAGWRNYHFVKLTTEDGLVGWSEFDEGFGAPGVTTAIERLATRIIGKNALQHERIYAELFCATRPAAGGVVALALGAIENALLDVKAKALGVPCYELLGGKIRDRIRVYWSHCATWRINHPDWYKPAITDLDGVKAIGREVREKRFTALDQHLRLYRRRADGLASRLRRAVPARAECRPHSCAISACTRRIRDGAGPMSIAARPQLQRQDRRIFEDLAAIEDMDMFWVEIDSFNPQALATSAARAAPDLVLRDIIGTARIPPYFTSRRWMSRLSTRPERGVAVDEDASAAEHFEVNVAPHNFYGHLCTMMNAHSARGAESADHETDIDRLAWDHEGSRMLTMSMAIS
jgi:L-alanine-DL-glutamate epimerase-like enolase superfamily enzyme